MIILAPGALDEVFSETSASKDASAETDSRFSSWLKSSPQGGPAAGASTPSVTTPYKKRLTRFE